MVERSLRKIRNL